MGENFCDSRLGYKSCDLVMLLKDVTMLHVVTESNVEGEVI